MKTYADFQNFCNQNLQKHFDEVKSERAIAVKKIILFRIIFTLLLFGNLLLVYVFTINQELIEENTIAIIVAVVLLIAYNFLVFKIFIFQRKIRYKYVSFFKDKIIKNIVKFFDETLTYYPEKFININSFEKSGLIIQKIVKYYGDDYVEGMLGDTKIQFAEVHALIEKKDKDNDKSYEEVFGGLFFIGDFNKNFKGQTYVYPDYGEKIFGRLAKYFQKLNKHRGELVNLEDIEFEKEFKVYSTDQIEARYILSTSLMQRIVNYKKKTKSDILMSFVDSNIYIGIPIKGQLFEPKIFGKLLHENTLKNYFEHFELVISVVEELNLNLRIWNKQ